MAAITSAVIAIAAVILGWITIEIACKPCLEKGREAIDRSLNPDYDPDEDNPSQSIRAPLNPNTNVDPVINAKDGAVAATSTTTIKIV
ncbi:PREDICTED: uncharacterized protein LOC104590955 [Nelumbo nucifera]|uniref:Outer envelope membrane protein 7 n=2 Tax=Nelumbo nucifera TaxID=4432 RepID=A0A822Z6L4_NELNU|nr:PREDICTED: uncharacterized protein LOC104590955 [Nelumbo nucifera]DAD37188.1 TPA_asm: hypothetical protein HUJ06_007829 [Nelumbo nucifera]